MTCSLEPVERVGERVSDFREAAQGFLHGHKLLPEEVETLENIHGIELFSEAIESLTEIALSGEGLMVVGVVPAELPAAQGWGAAASCGVRHDEGTLAGRFGTAAG